VASRPLGTKHETPAITQAQGAAFLLLAVLVGIVARLGAVAFRTLIALFHNLLFLGMMSVAYDANAHTPASPWGPLVVLVPVLGAFGVAFLVKNFAPEAKGLVVPEVVDAVYHLGGMIRPLVSVVKALACALSIGSGGSVGREGPSIQIGSSFGSTVGQILRLPLWQRITVIAAGAGGGIPSCFVTQGGRHSRNFASLDRLCQRNCEARADEHRDVGCDTDSAKVPAVSFHIRNAVQKGVIS
jgi:H+/Cl- antiporter ClcA